LRDIVQKRNSLYKQYSEQLKCLFHRIQNCMY